MTDRIITTVAAALFLLGCALDDVPTVVDVPALLGHPELSRDNGGPGVDWTAGRVKVYDDRGVFRGSLEVR